jgi:hypothetical protein
LQSNDLEAGSGDCIQDLGQGAEGGGLAISRFGGVVKKDDRTVLQVASHARCNIVWAGAGPPVAPANRPTYDG